MKDKKYVTFKSENPNADIKEKIKNDLLFKVFKELSLLKDQPRIQIFIAHGFIELLVNTIVKEKN